MNEILAASTIIVSIVLAVSSLIKTQITNARRLPVINVIIGVFIGGAYAISFNPNELSIFIWAGFLAGLAAGGFYDLGKGILIDQKKDDVDPDDQENNVR
ncbi:hypothetical protein JZO81_19465 [Enterococcus hulanensis]|uniref:holin n=1 Tax=Enterococcus TaxID=1350 RepID=UPI000B5A99DB|nr:MULTISPECIES: holin [Enterococcus]MBO0413240.1 hypothetical protein [Enterococcus hulanensis]OTO15091.1 hypothetical protein A5875_004248 [Enterococcus sp. 3H8_DIV0648]